MRLLPNGRKSVLDIGARDGHFSRLLAEHFLEVTALDIEMPAFKIPGVINLAGDITDLKFPANSFDCVFCTEVLEHVRNVEKACNEIMRVARHEIIIGVPFKQDTRVGRTTCQMCWKPNPPWGHVNTFDEERLISLFSGLRVSSKSFVGSTKEAASAFSAFLMNLARNPFGTYEQEEPCIYCGMKLGSPGPSQPWQKALSAIAICMNKIQTALARPHGTWIHLTFSKD